MAEKLHALIIDDIDNDLHLLVDGRYRFHHVRHIPSLGGLTPDGMIASLRRLVGGEIFQASLEDGAKVTFDIFLLNAHIGEGWRSKTAGIDLLWKGIRLNRNRAIALMPVLVYSTEPNAECLTSASRSRYKEDIFNVPACEFLQFGLRTGFISSLMCSLDALLTPASSTLWGEDALRRVSSVNARVLGEERKERLEKLLKDLHHYLRKKIPYKPDPAKRVKTLFHQIWVSERISCLLRPETFRRAGLEWNDVLAGHKDAIIEALRAAARNGLPRTINEALEDALKRLSSVIDRIQLLKLIESPPASPALISQCRLEINKIGGAFLAVSGADITAPRFPGDLISSTYDLRAYWQGRLTLELLLWQLTLNYPYEDIRHYVSKIFIEVLDPAADALELRSEAELAAAFSTDKLNKAGVIKGSTFGDLLVEVDRRLHEACREISQA